MTVRRFTLSDAPFSGRTGRGVLVAVVDSGVNAGHPHVGGVVESVRVRPPRVVENENVGATVVATPDAADPADATDRIGHGTAVAAAIREKAPGTDLLSVKIFDRTLATNAEALAAGITSASTRGARLINLSLGTANAERTALLRAAVEGARTRGSVVVSARESEGTRWLPGSLPDVAGVEVDWECEREELALVFQADGRAVFRASGYPRPIPGVPRERNLSGISFAVANVTGFLARLLEGQGELRSVDDILSLLRPPGAA